MMSGEFEFESNFLPERVSEAEGSNGTTQVIFLIFLFVVSIVISNLLIAMTVSKTEELFKKAGVIRLEKTVGQVQRCKRYNFKDLQIRSSSDPQRRS